MKENSYSLWSKPEILRKIDHYCLSQLCRFIRQEDFTNTERFKNSSEVLPKYNRLINFIFSVLLKEGILVEKEGVLHKTQKYDYFLKESPVIENDIFEQYKGIFSLLNKCFTSYIDIVQGKESAVNVLFPYGSSQYIRQILCNLTAPYSNEIVFPKTVANFIDKTPHIANILEVGGGSGSLTWPLLNALQNFPSTYMFSDISRSFLLDAKTKAEEKNYNFMNFAAINLNSPVICLLEEKYDAIIAHNVLHVTRDLDQTFDNLYQLLTEDGYVFIVELYQPFLWQHLVWGILDGWWSFQDGYRKCQPTLPVDQWRKLSKKHNFKVVESLPISQNLSHNDTVLMVIKKESYR